MVFLSRDDAIDWIARNQLGRRNASEVQKSSLRGRLYIERQARGDNLSPAPPVEGPKPNIAIGVAEETGVSERQIHRDAAFARTLDAIGERAPEVRDAILHGQVSRSDAPALAQASEEDLAEVAAAPPKERRQKAGAVADKVAAPKQDGKPIVHLKELHNLEQCAGALVRAKTAALKACNTEPWAKAFDEQMRDPLNTVFDIILAWQKESQTRRGG